jgi:uncharacterized membrane protein
MEADRQSGQGLFGIGLIAFSSAMIGLGVLSVIFRDFAYNWQPVPAFHPGRDVLALLCGLFMITAAMALLVRGTAPFASRAFFPFLIAWLLLKVPAVVAAPHVEGVWVGFGEVGMLLAGGWVLFGQLSGLAQTGRFSRATGQRGMRMAQILFGLAVLPVALGHLFYPQVTTSLVPSYLPFRTELAYLTGVGQIACGLALLLGVLSRAAAVTEGIMVALFALLVWGPGSWIAATPRMAGAPAGPRFALTAFLITCAVSGAAFLIAACCAEAAGQKALRAQSTTGA